MDSRATGADLGADLNGVAAVSDQIRRLGRQAFLMQLQATNAIVMSSSHGVRVPGFAIVSQQMRELSTELGNCLTELRSATVRWLSVVSHQVGRSRSIETLEATARMTPAAGAAARPVLERLRTEHAADPAPQHAQRAFILVLDDARRLASTGCVLARTAKLEATYGDRIAARLAESATSFTELADSVDEAVRTIARRLTAAARRVA
jgi:hypothetical protein